MEVGVRNSVRACDCNGGEVHRCELRKGDQGGGPDIGFLGRNLGRALCKVTLQTRPGQTGYGCIGEGHTVEAGMGRGCLKENKGYEHYDKLKCLFTPRKILTGKFRAINILI